MINSPSAVLTIVISLFLTAGAFGQSKPAPTPMPTLDFTGTWIYVKTDPQKFAARIPPSPSPNGGKPGNAGPREIKRVITQTATTLTKRIFGEENGKSYAFERTYFLDGRGETNPIEDDPDRAAFSKTKLTKHSLIVDVIVKKKTGEPVSKIPQREEWKISDNGKTLTVTSCPVIKSTDRLMIQIGSELCIKTTSRRE